jgi:hypothetical protein
MARLSYIRFATYLVLAAVWLSPKRHFIPVDLAVPDEAQFAPPDDWNWRSPAEDITRQPREDEIAQFLVERPTTPPAKRMSRDEFLEFFRKGRFGGIAAWIEEDSRYRATRSGQTNSSKSIPVLCQGAFAVKSGDVFLWRLVKEKVLEIEDSEHHTGWLFLDIPSTKWKRPTSRYSQRRQAAVADLKRSASRLQLMRNLPRCFGGTPRKIFRDEEVVQLAGESFSSGRLARLMTSGVFGFGLERQR